MGAAGSSENCLSLSKVSIHRRLVLTNAQRGKVEEGLFQLAAKPQQLGARGSGEEELGEESGGQGAWLVFYDNSASALTLRDWWLREQSGSWLLRVPQLKSDGGAGMITSGYEELTNVEEILEKVGLVQHAQALRKGIVSNVTKLLSQAGVTPFARVHAEDGCYYQLGGQSSTGSASAGGEGGSAAAAVAEESAESGGLVLALRQLRFDVRYAEDEAVSRLLFEKGTAGREALGVSLAEFCLPKETSIAEADQATVAKLTAAGFAHAIPAQVAFPEAIAYLEALRPAHLRALRRAGVACADR